MADVERLCDLHDAYVWKVNAAVGDNRLDLVWELADEYLDQALRLVSAGEPVGCGRPDCVVCARPGPAAEPPARRRRRWVGRLSRNAPSTGS